MEEMRRYYVEEAKEFSPKRFDEMVAEAKVAWEAEEDKDMYEGFEEYFELEYLGYPED